MGEGLASNNQSFLPPPPPPPVPPQAAPSLDPSLTLRASPVSWSSIPKPPLPAERWGRGRGLGKQGEAQGNRGGILASGFTLEKILILIYPNGHAMRIVYAARKCDCFSPQFLLLILPSADLLLSLWKLLQDVSMFSRKQSSVCVCRGEPHA